MRRRHPTPGYTATLELFVDHLDVPSRVTESGLEFDGTERDIERAMRKVGIYWGDSEIFPGRQRGMCVICGESQDVDLPVCDPEKHEAYYDALEER